MKLQRAARCVRSGIEREMTRIADVDFDLATVASFAAFDWHGGLHVEELSVAHTRVQLDAMYRMRYTDAIRPDA